MSQFVTQIVDAIRTVSGTGCALHEPQLSGNASTYVVDCIDTGWVSSVGSYVDRFEQEVAAIAGTRFGIATVNGTAALHAALLLVGVTAGDEVIVPAMSFVATANAVRNCHATPAFVDINAATLGMCPDALEAYLQEHAHKDGDRLVNRLTGQRIAAIVPMHTFGHPCDMERLCEIADRYSLPIVEDAAESLGSYCHDRHTGSFGRLGVISFNGNKIVTTGGGGAIVTDDEALAAKAKHLTTTGKIRHPWFFEHDCHAFNYRMPNLNAALGCSQLEQLPEFLATKRKIAHAYREALSGIQGVRFVEERQSCRSNYWLNAICLSDADESVRDAILNATNAVGIGTRACWTPLNRLPMYQDCPKGDLSVTDRFFASAINIPSGCGLWQGS